MTFLAVDYPEPGLIERLLRQYAPVRLEADVAGLPEGDRQALRHLAEASRWINRIYWKQRSEEGWAIKQSLVATGTRGALERLLDLGFGPWDVFDNDRPFLGGAPRPPGGTQYPVDLTREEINRYLSDHPDEKDVLVSPISVVRRAGDRLMAVSYSDVFATELMHIAEALTTAGRHATHSGFARFLQERAVGLRRNALRASEALWIGVGDSPIDVAIGPYEVYDDGLLGLKASYESTVLVRHPISDRLAELEAVAAELATILPGSVAAPGLRPRVAIGVYDVVFSAGSANMGAKTIAQMLPNDEWVRREHGSRLLLYRNVIAAKFAPILKPLAGRLLRPEAAALVEENAFVLHTLLHEMAHALVAGPQVDDGPDSANQLLQERYSTIEECRADLVALVFLDHLSRSGRSLHAHAPQVAATFVASALRMLRFGAHNDYGRAASIILSHLMRAGAIALDADGRLGVDPAATLSAVRVLAERVQTVRTEGRYAEAGALIDELGTLPAGIAPLLDRLEGLPVDLEFTFDPSLLG